MVDTSNNNTVIETKTCSRCGGSGSYSWCQRYGSRCFKCAGAGKVYTKRGLAAHNFFENLLSKPAGQLKPGDKIKTDMVTSEGVGKWWETVVEVRWGTDQDGGYIVDGVTKRYFHIITNKCDHGIFNDTDMYRVAATKEQKAAAFQQALAYQATLTQTGTVKKTKAK